MTISRRGLLLGMAAVLAGCTTDHATQRTNYAARNDEGHPLPSMPVKAELRRTEVDFSGAYNAGTIVINTPQRRLYYVLGNGRAIRYAISVGREGLELRGNAYIGRKAQWPSWTPTANMIRRDPKKYGPLAGGMKGGLNNPLGARAMYLYRGGGDIHFRIHGTNAPSSIGYAMSSGCIRMLNHDVIDLYSRANVGGKVVVIQG